MLIDYKRKQERSDWEKQAYLASVIINFSERKDPKKPMVTVDDLLKKEEEEDSNEIELPDEAYFEQIKKKYGS